MFIYICIYLSLFDVRRLNIFRFLGPRLILEQLTDSSRNIKCPGTCALTVPTPCSNNST